MVGPKGRHGSGTGKTTVGKVLVPKASCREVNRGVGLVWWRLQQRVQRGTRQKGIVSATRREENRSVGKIVVAVLRSIKSCVVDLATVVMRWSE